MRLKLKNLSEFERYTFTAIFCKFGKSPITKRKNVLLLKISINGDVLAEHMWVRYNEKYENLKYGDEITFNARKYMYVKGYFNPKKDGWNKSYDNIEPDYGLKNITKITKTGRNLRSELYKERKEKERNTYKKQKQQAGKRYSKKFPKRRKL